MRLLVNQSQLVQFGPLYDPFLQPITNGTALFQFIDSQGLIWNGTSWQGGTYWFQGTNLGSGFYGVLFTPNKPDLIYILLYFNSSWGTFYMLETIETYTTFLYDYTGVTPKLCYIQLVDPSFSQIMGKIVTVQLECDDKDIYGNYLAATALQKATDGNGIAYFLLIPNDKLQNGKKYILSISGNTYRFSISSSDAEPINILAKLI